MIRGIRIENFRCFERIELNDLGTINVIVGESSSGKTAFLEAIFLASSGSPDKVFPFRKWRGLGSGLSVSRSADSYESLWKDLFYQFNQSKAIDIHLSGTPENTRHLRVFYDKATPATVTLTESNGASSGFLSRDTSAIVPIVFQTQHADEAPETLKPEFTADGLTFGGMNRGSKAVFFNSTFMSELPPKEHAQRFSALRMEGKDAPILRAMKSLFPAIGELSVEALSEPTLCCSLPGSRDKKRIPVGLLSSGASKLLSLLLGLASQPNGVALIDEIENGLYYKAMPEVWKSLFQFSRANNVQLFVSTHSLECLRAILPVIKGHEKEFRLIRPEGRRSRREVRMFYGEDLEAALLTESEVR